MVLPRLGLPDLGVGIGLRVPHYRQLFSERPHVDFLEIISENFMVRGGRPRAHLDRARESYRLVQHGVSLGIGSAEPLDRDHLDELRRLVRHVKPPWVSDHLCWSRAGGAHLHDLLPLPYTDETVRLVAERARVVQDFLEVPFALENTSSYLTYTDSTMSEAAFVAEVVERADVGLLLDVNNVYVSAFNHGFDPWEFVASMPHDRVVQIHLAGHTHLGKVIIDTHRGHVAGEVLDLYAETIRHTGPVSTLIEWDDEIPELPVVLAEAERARAVRERACRERTRGAAARPQPRPAPAEAAPGAAPRAWTQGGPRETPLSTEEAQA